MCLNMPMPFKDKGQGHTADAFKSPYFSRYLSYGTGFDINIFVVFCLVPGSIITAFIPTPSRYKKLVYTCLFFNQV